MLSETHENPLLNKLPELSLKYALEQYLYTDTFTQRFQDLWNSVDFVSAWVTISSEDVFIILLLFLSLRFFR